MSICFYEHNSSVQAEKKREKLGSCRIPFSTVLTTRPMFLLSEEARKRTSYFRLFVGK
jgi:hypothetical protein